MTIRKGDNVPEDALRRIKIDIDLINHLGKFQNRPDFDQILKRARELVVEKSDVKLVRNGLLTEQI